MTKKENIIAHLRHAIVSGKFKPGEHIVEQDLCSLLGVSRSPVREALNQLEKEGLVTIKNNVGAKVVDLTLDDLSHIYDVIEVIDGAASRLACDKLNDEEIKELKEYHFMMIDASNQNNLELVFELNIQFHKYINEHTNNQYLMEIWTNLRSLTYFLTHFSPFIAGQAKATIEGHQKIIDAIESRNPSLAEFDSRNHIKVAKRFMLNYYKGLKDNE